MLDYKLIIKKCKKKKENYHDLERKFKSMKSATNNLLISNDYSMKKQINWMTTIGHWKRKKMQMSFMCMIMILLFSPNIKIYSQNNEGVKLTGVVKDSNDEPIPGVNIVDLKAQKGTISDINGKFTLVLKNRDTKVLFSFIGFKEQTIEIKENLNLDITLVEDMVGLDEVIKIGYGSTTKLTNTGSVSKIKGAEIIKSPVVSISNALAGAAPGITAIQTTGRPGDDFSEILIRGFTSLDRGSSQPLILVDGVERSYNDIDPQAIEDLVVLKDASTTAIYGIRGANGVILITTKRGEVGKMKVSVNASYGLQSRQKLLEKPSSFEHATIKNEYDTYSGTNPEDLVYTPEMLERWKKGDQPLLYPDMDWEDYLLKDYAPQQVYSISLRGGTKKVRYFANLGYTNQKGLIETFDTRYDHNSSFKRYNYRLNLDIDATPTTTLSVNLGASTNQKTGNIREHEIWGRLAIAYPMSSPGIIDGKFYTTNQDLVPNSGYCPLDRFYKAGVTESTTNNINTDFVINQNLDFITKGLRAKAQVSFNTAYNITRQRYSEPDIYQFAYARDPENWNEFLLDDNGEKVLQEQLIKQGDRYWFAKNSLLGGVPATKNWYAEGNLTYGKSIGDHKMHATLVYSQHTHFYPGSRKEVPTSVLGFAGRVSYSYQYKYLVDFNLARNGSENFPKKERFGIFPAVSAGYVVSEESFLKDKTFISYLKFKGSWGKVGMDKMGGRRFLYLPVSWHTNAKTGYNFGIDSPQIKPGSYEGALGNQGVTWETETKVNLGMESQFFDGLIGLNVDVFKNHREGILLSPKKATPAHFALAMPPINLGEVENKGWEAQLTVKDQINNFSYRIDGSVSYAKNKIVYADEIDPPYSWMRKTGQKVGQNYGYEFLGFYTEELAASAPVGYGEVRAGDVIWKDQNDDGSISDVDKVPIGNPTYPEYNFGLNTHFKWKNIDMTLRFHGVTNVDRMVSGAIRAPFELIDRGLWKYMYDERWTPETAETATYPAVGFNRVNYADGDLWMKRCFIYKIKGIGSWLYFY